MNLKPKLMPEDFEPESHEPSWHEVCAAHPGRWVEVRLPADGPTVKQLRNRAYSAGQIRGFSVSTRGGPHGTAYIKFTPKAQTDTNGSEPDPFGPPDGTPSFS